MLDKVSKLVKGTISEEYPYLDGMPYLVMAKVTKVNQGTVNIRLLNKAGNIDTTVSEIPNITTEIELVIGDIVRVGFYYSDLSMPYIDAKIGG